MKFYLGLDMSNLRNSMRFGRTFRPLFSNKSGCVSQKVTLVKDESIISCESQRAECFSHYFINITDSLPIEPYVRDPIIDVLSKYDNHPRVVLLKSSIRCTQTFEFQPFSCVDIVNKAKILDRSKKTSGTLSIDIIKKITGIYHTQLAE